MGQALGDFDGDLKLDWYVTSIYVAGSGFLTGNKLYYNLGDHLYQQWAIPSGVNAGGYGWGALATDFNHDGRLDIAETNGAFSGNYQFEQSYLWLSDDDGTFVESAIASGLIHNGQGRGMIGFDYDNDGDRDIVIVGNGEPTRLYRNDLDTANARWLRVELDTRTHPGLAPHGIGSRVVAEFDGVEQLRYLHGGDAYLSHSELSAHFGAGTSMTAASLRVEWTDGNRELGRGSLDRTDGHDPPYG